MVQERHRHRFELNNSFRDIRYALLRDLTRGGWLTIAELVDHPFMLGTQFHPRNFLPRPHRFFASGQAKGRDCVLINFLIEIAESSNIF